MADILAKQIKEMPLSDLPSVADNLRKQIIESTAKNGGHLSSNLGIVEITMMLHRNFDFTHDQLLFDVGHQSYAHKLITGRSLDRLRHSDGVSGFQKREESVYDVFEAGHSSTSLSAGLGMAIARDLNQDHYEIVVVIGDGSISSGPSFEALNDIAHLHHKLIIILNDNEMSISKPVGGTAKLFSRIRISSGYTKAKTRYQRFLSKTKVGRAFYRFTSRIKNAFKRLVLPSTYFESLGIDYLGPIDGHDIVELDKTLKKAKKSPHTILVHCFTTKGKGYSYAEKDTLGHWHGVQPFQIETGVAKEEKKGLTWSAFYSQLVDESMQKDENIVYLNPAMIYGSEAMDIFEHYPTRAFDVGIAEEHCLSMASGLAINKKHPIVAIYSTFLQRAIDQLNQDLCRMELPCTLLIDRAGLVGADGETHQGIYEEAFLLANPNIIVSMAATEEEAKQLFHLSLTSSIPFAIRYPRSKMLVSKKKRIVTLGKWLWYRRKHEKILVIGVGPLLYELYQESNHGNLRIDFLNALFLKPMDEHALKNVLDYSTIVLYSPYSTAYGWVNQVMQRLFLLGYQGKVIIKAVPDQFVKQATQKEQLKAFGLDVASLIELLKKEEKVC